MNTEKEKYRSLCGYKKSIPLFSKDWWLDAVCGENNWDVVLAEEGGKIVGALPFYFVKRLGFRLVKMPLFTQTMGIWLQYPPEIRQYKTISFESRVIATLLNKLPPFDNFSQNFHFNFSNWLPLYWKGFHQTTRYTQVIEGLTDLDKVYANFDSDIRRKLRKASNNLAVTSEDTLTNFYEVNKQVFARQNLKTPYHFSHLKTLDAVCKKNKSRKTFFVEDSKGNTHSVLYLVWDDNSSYLLLCGDDLRWRSSDANALATWKAIEFTAQELKLNCFDFEGSMIKNITIYKNQRFGATLKPYFHIDKTVSKLLKLRHLIKKLG